MLLLFQGLFRSAAFARNPNPRFQIPEPVMGKALRRKIFARRKEIHQQQYNAALGRNQKQILRYAALRSE